MCNLVVKKKKGGKRRGREEGSRIGTSSTSLGWVFPLPIRKKMKKEVKIMQSNSTIEDIVKKFNFQNCTFQASK